MSGTHARLAPSSAHRWVGCAASPFMEARYPEDEESDAAREGTAAHWVLEQLLDPSLPAPTVGQITPNGYPVSREMIDGAIPLANDVVGACMAAGQGCTFAVEQTVTAAKWIAPDNFGTPDVYLFDRERRHVAIWDFKFGHRSVDPYRNWQMLNYAAGVLETHGVMPSELDIYQWRFTFTICQPRSYHRDGPLREWQADGKEVCALLNELREAARLASDPAALCTTGDHCRDCRAQWDCRANQLMGGAAQDVAFEQQSTDMKPAALGLEARQIAWAIKRLEARKTSLDERILAVMRSGQTVPHWTIGSTKPRTVWKDDEQAISMAAMFGHDIAKTVPSVTPVQARKLGIDAEVIDSYSTTPPGAVKLVAADDNAAARVFGIRD